MAFFGGFYGGYPNYGYANYGYNNPYAAYGNYGNDYAGNIWCGPYGGFAGDGIYGRWPMSDWAEENRVYPGFGSMGGWGDNYFNMFAGVKNLYHDPTAIYTGKSGYGTYSRRGRWRPRGRKKTNRNWARVYNPNYDDAVCEEDDPYF